MKPLIAPSILSANFARLGEDVKAVLDAGAEIVHFDVMDNHFVPNLTIGPLICEALRNDGIEAPIDVHLMVEPVDRIIPDFASAGASYITFHPEATMHLDRALQLIRDLFFGFPHSSPYVSEDHRGRLAATATVELSATRGLGMKRATRTQA